VPKKCHESLNPSITEGKVKKAKWITKVVSNAGIRSSVN